MRLSQRLVLHTLVVSVLLLSTVLVLVERRVAERVRQRDAAAGAISNDEFLAHVRRDIIINGLDVPGAHYPGFGLANPIGWSSFLIGFTPPPWTATSPPPAGYTVFDTYTKGLYGLDYDFVTDFEFDNEQYVLEWRRLFDEVYAASGEADPANLERFERAGGKVLIWHGVADNAISVNDTIEFYEGIAANTPRDPVEDFARLFLVPGLLHCGGGLGPSDVPAAALSAIVDWVENENPPESLVTHSATRSFLLCPYPQRSVFVGGDVNDAASWRCESA